MGDFNFVANTPQYNSLNNTEDSNAKRGTIVLAYSMIESSKYSTTINLIFIHKYYRIDFYFYTENIDVNNWLDTKR
jgi:hypothetical protein